MLKALIHLALIGSLLGCPPSCLLRSMLAETSGNATAGVAVAHGDRSCGGCCCHHAAAPRETSAAPTRDGSLPQPQLPRPCDHDNSSGPCQCICGGAVFENPVAFDAADAVHLLDALAAAPMVADLTPPEVDVALRRCPPDDDVLTGREICRLYSLMLC